MQQQKAERRAEAENLARTRRANRGSFRPGPDPRRHRFTREECSAGFWAALEAYTVAGGEPRYFLKRKMEARGQVYRHRPRSARGRVAPGDQQTAAA